MVKEFKLRFTTDVSDLEKQFKGATSELAKMIKNVGAAEDKFEVLKDAGAWLSQIDKQLSSISSKYPDVFNKIFGSIDQDITNAIDPILKMPDMISSSVMKVGKQLQSVLSGVGGTKEEFKEIADSLTLMSRALGKNPPDFSFLNETGNATNKANKLLDVLANIVQTSYNVQSSGNKISDAIDRVGASAGRASSELDKLKRAQDLVNRTLKSLKGGHIFSGEDILGEIKNKNDPKEVFEYSKRITDTYKTLGKEVSDIKKKMFSGGELNFDEYEKIIKYGEAASKLSALSSVSGKLKLSEQSREYISSLAASADTLAETFFEQIKKSLDKRIKNYGSDDLLADTKTTKDKKVKSTDNAKSTQVLTEAYKKLNQQVQEYIKLKEKLATIPDDDEDKYYEVSDKMDEIANRISKEYNVDADDIQDKLSNAIGDEVDDVETAVKSSMGALKELFGTKFPKMFETVQAQTKSTSAILPTSDGLKQNGVIVSADQKAQVGKLAEEYRVILTLLEKGDAESKSVTDSLKERASTIKKIIQDIKPIDMNLGDLLKKTYDIPTGTANYLTSAKIGQKFKIDSFNSKNVTEETRQKAVDLIYKEIAAENQLIQKKKEEVEASSGDTREVSLEREKQLTQELAALKEKLNAIPTNPVDEAELNDAKNKLQELQKEADSWKDSYDEIHREMQRGSSLDGYTSDDVVDSYREKIDQLYRTISTLNEKLAETETKLSGVQSLGKNAADVDGILPKDSAEDASKIKEETEAIKEQTVAIEQNNTAQQQSLSVQSDVSLNEEYQSLEALREKLETIKNAVNDKTAAFNAEKEAVSGNVTSEILELDKLKSALQEILNSLQNINKTDLNFNVEQVKSQIDEIFAKLTNPSYKNEHLGLLNSKTGKVSDEYFEGTGSRAEGKFKNKKDYDTMFHNHPDVSTAIPSITDWKTFLSEFNNFRRQIILTKDEIATFDLSQMTRQELSELVNAIKSELSKAKYDKEWVKDIEQYGKDEATQRWTKRTTMGVLAQHSNLQMSTKPVTQNTTATNANSSTVQAEIEALNSLEKKIFDIKYAIEEKTSAFVNEKQIVDGVVTQEIASLDTLLAKINEIKGAVDIKTEAFKSEGSVVTESVKQATKIKEETKKKDTFDIDKEKFIGAVSEYEKSLSGVQFIPDDALNKVSEMQAKLKDITNSNDLAKWKSEWDLLTESIESARKEQEELIFEKQKNQLTGIKNTLSNSYKSAKIDATNVPEELQEVETGYEDIVARINTCIKQRKMLTEEEVAGFAREAAAIKQVLDAYTEKTKVQTKNSSAYGSAFVKNATNKYDRLYSIATNDEFGVSPAIVAKAQELKSVYEQIVSLNKSFANTNPSEEQRIAFNRLTDEFNETYSALDKIVKSSRKLAQSGSNIFELYNDGKTEFDLSSEEGRMTALKEAVNFMSDGKAQIGEFNRECTALNYTVKNSDGTFTEFTARINEAGTAIVETTGKTKKSTTMFGGFFDELKRKARGIATYLISITSFQRVWQEIRQGITYIKEIDSALTELKKVTDETDETYEKFLATASQVGSEIGSTIADFTNATADFARLGYTISEATELAKAASIYKNVGDGIESVSQATESIISTMKAFGIEAEDSMSIVDKFNEVGNRFAISSTGIGEALQRSASALYESGNTIDESIALITAANSVIQNPEQVGTALKTLSLRLRGAKVELQEAGEDTDNMAESVSSLQTKLLALTHGKVDIMADATTFKNTTEILREMSSAWSDMTDIERAAALELMGGKRQANILASIIKNYDTVDDVIEASLDSQNSAYEENAKWMDSIEGKMTEFKNAVQSLWKDSLGPNAIKDVISLGTGLVNIVDTIGAIPTILGGIAVYFFAIKKNNPVTMFKDLANTIQNFSAAASSVQELSKAKVVFDSNSVNLYAAAVANLSAKQQALALSSAGLTKKQVAEVLAKNGCSEATIEQAVAEASLATAKETTSTITGEQLFNLAAEKDIKLSEQAITWLCANAETELTREKILAAIASKDLAEADGMALLAMSGLSAGAKGLGASLKALFLSNPVGLALMAVTAITAIVMAVKRAKEEAKQAAQEILNAYKDAQNTLKSNKNTINEISSDYERLSKGVDDFGNNISLTTDEYKKYNEITNKIADMFPEMISGYTKEGNAILSCKGNVEELTKAYEAAAQAARQAAIAGGNDVFESSKKEYSNNPQTILGGETGTVNKKILANKLIELVNNGNEEELKQFIENFEREAAGVEIDGKKFFKVNLIDTLEDAGIEVPWNNVINAEDIQNGLQKLQSFVKSSVSKINTETSKVKSILSAYLGEDENYAKLDDKTKSIVDNIVSQLDSEFIFSFDNIDSLYNWISENIVGAFKDNGGKVQDAISDFLKIDTSKLSVSDYKKEIENFKKILSDSGISEEAQQQILSAFKIDDDSIKEEIDPLVNHTKSILKDEFDDKVDSLTISDLKIVDSLDIPDGTLLTWDELLERINAVKSEMRTPVVQTYDTIKGSIENFNDVQKQTEDIMLDNTEVTQEYKDSLVALGISETDLASCFDKNNKLVVKNVSRLKQLVNASKTNISTQTILARAQARLKYKELYKQLATLTNGQLNSAQANREKINTLYQEMSAIQKVISRYSLLEQQLSEVTKTYSEFEEAQSFDSDNDYMSKTEDMLTAAIKAYETGDLGTETAQVAIKALVPDVEFEGLDTVDEKAEKAHEYLTETLNKYFTLEFDDNGAIQSAEMKLGNLRKFIEDAFSNNVFAGEDWQHFEWSDEFLAGLENAPDKLQYFADEMNVTKEVALAAIQEIKNKDAEWLNGDYGSLFDQIVPETLDAKLQDTTTKLAELNVQLANGKISQEEYETATKQLNAQLVEQQKAASDACQSFIDVNGKIDESQKKLEAYQKQLSTGTDTNGNKLTSEQIEEINGKYNQELQNYEGYLKQKKELENKYGPMTEYTVSVALEQNGINVDEINTELTNVKQNIQEAFNSDNFKGANKALEDTYGVIAKINENGDIEYSVTDNTSDDQKKTLEELGALNDDGTVNIDCLYAGLTDEQKAEVDKLETLQEKKNLIDYYLSMDGVDTVQSSIDELATTLTKIYELLQTSPMFKANVDQDTKTTLNGLLDKVNSWVGDHWASFKAKVFSIFGGNSGDQESNGTANVSGTAHATGSWGLEQSEHNALVGELGMETVVDPNTGRYYTVGDHGAELVDLPKNAIVFNHKQTEELFKNGHINSRGKAYAEGNAHVTIYPKHSISSQWEGTGYSSWDDNTYDASDALQYASDSIDSAADDVSDAADKFEEVFDWFEVLLEEIEDNISLMNAKLENAVGISAKKGIYSEILNTEQFKLQELYEGIKLYSDYANKLLAKVPDQYKAMAKNGAVAITDFLGEANEEVVDSINNYREWAKKVSDLNQQLEETKKTIADTHVEIQNTLKDEYDNRISLITSVNDRIQDTIDLLDEEGKRSSAVMYEEMIKNSTKQLSELQNKRAEMQRALDEAVSSGDVARESSQWYEMVNAINDVDGEINDCRIDLEGFQNSINQLHWDNFEKFIDAIDNVSTEISNLGDLIDEEDVVDEIGNWTKKGITALGLYAQEMERAKYRAGQYGKEIEYLNQEYAAGKYSVDEYNEKLQELKDGQWDSIKSYESAKKSIIDLNKTRVEAIKDGIQKEIDAYSELIDKKKEELNLQKDAHDFQKEVAEKQKSIAEIQKKLSVMAGDNSASAIAQKKQLQAQLSAAQEELDELYYNHSIEKQGEALDKQLENYQDSKDKEMEQLDESLKNEEQVISDSYATIAANTESVAQTLAEIASQYGITLSDSVTKPWLDGANAIGTYQEQLDTSMSSFTQQLEALKKMYADLQAQADSTGKSMIDAINSNKSKTESSTYTPPQSTQPSTPSQPSKPSAPSAGASVTVKKSATNFSRDGGNGTRMQSWVPGSTFTVYQVSGSEVLIGRNGGYTGWVRLSDIEGYAKGTKGVTNDQLAMLDELGEELVLHAGKDGKLQFLTKGTSVIPSDITENLMKLGSLDPRQVLDNNRPSIGAPHIINNNMEINMEIAEVVHIDHADNSSIPDITKAVQKQMDAYMKNINQGLKRYTR